MDAAQDHRERPLDILVIGAGIGGVIALHYARKAGLSALCLERQPRVGGLWAQLPPWQDIQYGRADWTLGDLPIAGEDQASIRDNIEAWVDRFGLRARIRLDTGVLQARHDGTHWLVRTENETFVARHLIAATGAHNRPVVPTVARHAVSLREMHSASLRDARELHGRDVVVVGGGASAYDLLDLCFEHHARRIVWVYRSTKWMLPTRKPKSESGGPRGFAQPQMAGATAEQLSDRLNADMVARYAKLGLVDIQPSRPFDMRRDQLIPGRWRMIEGFDRIERHRGEIVRIDAGRIELSNGAEVTADLLLWGTGYEIDLSCFASERVAGIRCLDELVAECGAGIRSLSEPNLYFLAAGLESTGTAPWGYALLARTIVSHIQGSARLEDAPLSAKLNYFDLAFFLAARDARSFPPAQWRADFSDLASIPANRPFPIPD